jgi:Ras-related protein Rab-2A
MSYSYLFKLIVIGDQGVGKSNLLKRFAENSFNEKHVTTIGVEFGAKIIKVRNVNVKLQVWDTAGQEAFISITRGYFRSAAGAMVMYDVGCRESFLSLKRWLAEAREHSIEAMSYILVGNKTDLPTRKVSVEEARAFAQQEEMPYIEVSAKSGDNVADCFYKLTELVFDKVVNGRLDVTGENGVRTGPEYVRAGESQANLGVISLEQPVPVPAAGCTC